MPDSPPPPDLQALLAGLIPALQTGLPPGVGAIVVLLDASTAEVGASHHQLMPAAHRAAQAAILHLALARGAPTQEVRDDD